MNTAELNAIKSSIELIKSLVSKDKEMKSRKSIILSQCATLSLLVLDEVGTKKNDTETKANSSKTKCGNKNFEIIFRRKKFHSVKEFADYVKLPYGIVYGRHFVLGWTPERIATTAPRSKFSVMREDYALRSR